MARLGLTVPAPLGDDHDLSRFSCGESILDDWLRGRAGKNEQIGASRTYVVCEEKKVAAYYSLAVGSLEHKYFPGPVKRNMPHPVPVMILARLVVDKRYAVKNIGTALLRDAVLRTLQVSHIAGLRALVVHALHAKAAAFYANRGFLVFPIEPLSLFLPLSRRVVALLSGNRRYMTWGLSQATHIKIEDTMSAERITELAKDYIAEMLNQSELSDEEILEDMRNHFRKNASSLSNCFADTSEWAEGECGGDEEAEVEFQRALEAEIVRQIMEDQEW